MFVLRSVLDRSVPVGFGLVIGPPMLRNKAKHAVVQTPKFGAAMMPDQTRPLWRHVPLFEHLNA